MPKLIRSSQADADLDEIVDYIAVDSPIAAFAWLESIQNLFVLLSRQPKLGERYTGRRLGEVRRFSHGNYVVYYQPFGDGVEILRVLHGARDERRQV